MSIQLDGDDVLAGDQVYDIARGEGVVRELLPANGMFVVQFSNGRRFSYNTAGASAGGIRTLFWSNPVVFTPSKGSRTNPNQAMFNRIVANIAEELL